MNNVLKQSFLLLILLLNFNSLQKKMIIITRNNDVIESINEHKLKMKAQLFVNFNLNGNTFEQLN